MTNLLERTTRQGSRLETRSESQYSYRRRLHLQLMPQKWAERYYNLKRWTVMPTGGHFAPMEEPKLLVDDLRAFFRTLR